MLVEVSFGEWLKRRRTALGLTQEQLALQISCSTSALRKFEAEERRPSAQIIERLAEIFNIPPNEQTTFLRFARGDWQAAPSKVTEEAPWRDLTALPRSNLPASLTSLIGREKEQDEIKNFLANNLPTGTVTFLFTDIEGSTQLWEEHPEAMKAAHARHEIILRQAMAAHGGYTYKMIGDAFQVAFATAPEVLAAALDAQRALYAEPWPETASIRVRMALHTGVTEERGDDYVGPALNRVARLLGVGHGGQVLLTQATYDLVRDDLPKDAGLRDLGEHRLKDLVRTEHIYQLTAPDLPSDYPPLKTLGTFAHNLPAQVTSFIGRENEIAEVRHLLAKTRLLTLTGPGGTGKTRLSLQVAAEVLDTFPDGVWLVELAPILDPLLIPRTTAIAMGLRDEPQRPVIDMLCDYLRHKKMLIILDNCEHLVEACAQLTNQILRVASNVRILASSREALGIAGEMTYRVPSLGLPDLQQLPPVESLRQYEAIKLFIDRATAIVQNFTVTDENAPALAQVCHHLDGIPLAIELAATKVRVLSLEQIRKRLDDRFGLLTGGSRTALERHQTLRATLDWSYNLLSVPEQILFSRLSIFVDGWTLEAAEFLCSDNSTMGEIQSTDVLNLLEQLVNKSLISAEEWQREKRYRVLETMRQYASEKLVEEGRNEKLRDSHLAYFLTLAESAAPHLLKPEQLGWLARLEAEHENMRAALEWSLSKESAEPSLRLCAALGTFWSMHSYFLEGSKWLKSALSKPTDSSNMTEKAARVKALYQNADLAQNIDNLEQMRISSELSLALAKEGSDKRDVAIARFYVGQVWIRKGNGGKARPLIEQSLAEFQVLNEPYWELQAYSLLGDILINQGELKSTEKTFHDLELARKAGERLSLAHALLNYSYWLFDFNQIGEARKYAEEAELLFREIGSTMSSSSFLFARISWLNGDYEGARLLYMEMQERFDLLGEKNLRAGMILELGLLALEQGHVDQALAYFQDALATGRELEYGPNIFYVAACLAGLSNIYYLQGDIEMFRESFRESVSLASELLISQKNFLLVSLLKSISSQLPESSARLLGVIDISQEELGIPMDPLGKRHCDRAETHARKALGDATFEEAYNKGRAMTIEQAVAYALEDSGS